MNKVLPFCIFLLFLFASAAILLFPATVKGQDEAAATLSLDKIKANVAKVVDPAEKGRWMSNIDLWVAKLAQKDKPTADETAKMKGSLSLMSSNVAKITEANEKERWQENLDLWSALVDLTDKASPAEAEKMKASLDLMNANVAQIKETAEKERWQFNVELWTTALSKL